MEKVKVVSSDSTQARIEGRYLEIARSYDQAGICVFCDLENTEQLPIVESRNGSCLLIVNKFPRTDGDSLIITRRHIEHISQLNKEEVEGIHQLKLVAMELITTTYGYNEFYDLTREGGDKTVKHYHTHVQPYRRGLVEWSAQTDLKAPVETAKRFKDMINTLKGINNGKI